MYALPLLSGLLLLLVFYPFYLWPVAFLALVPVYIAAAQATGVWQAFRMGCIAGLLGLSTTVLFSLGFFLSPSYAVLFEYLVRAGGLLVLVIIALLFGAAMAVYRLLRTDSLLFNSLVGAVLWVVMESTLFYILDGYYVGSVAYAVVPLPLALLLGSLGGFMSVAGMVAWVNTLIAESLLHWRARRSIPRALCAVPVVLGLLYGWGVAHPTQRDGDLSIRIATIQTNTYVNAGSLYAEPSAGAYINTSLGARLRAAAADADLLMYPHSPVAGELSVAGDRSIGSWLSHTVPTSTSVLLWNFTHDDAGMHEELAIWHAGEKTAYQKERLYRYADLRSWWSVLAPTHAPVVPGQGSGTAQVLGVPLGGLICSELHQPGIAAARAAEAPILLAVGTDAMAQNAILGNASLAAAQYRAAEQGVPVIRSSIMGPSAIINPDGSIRASLGYLEEGVLRGTVEVPQAHKTLYAQVGDLPLQAISLLTLVAALVVRRRGYATGQ